MATTPTRDNHCDGRGNNRKTAVCDATECGVILSPNRRPHVPFIPVLLRSSSHNSLELFDAVVQLIETAGRLGRVRSGAVRSISLSLSLSRKGRAPSTLDCLAAVVAVSTLSLLLLLLMVIIIVLLRYKRCTITTLPPHRVGFHTLQHNPHE